MLQLMRWGDGGLVNQTAAKSMIAENTSSWCEGVTVFKHHSSREASGVWQAGVLDNMGSVARWGRGWVSGSWDGVEWRHCRRPNDCLRTSGAFLPESSECWQKTRGYQAAWAQEDCLAFLALRPNKKAELSEVLSSINSVTALCFSHKPSDCFFRESCLRMIAENTSRSQEVGWPVTTGVSVTLGCKQNENGLVIH